MIGALFGDIVGSIYEWDNIKTKDFELYQKEMFFTDDSVMTLAIAKALMDYKKTGKDLSALTIGYMRNIGIRYPDAGYGGRFMMWLLQPNPQPYNSWGNGSAMRVSACGWVANSVEEAKELSRAVTAVTHNHPEGIKGAEATAVAIYMARQHSSKEEIKKEMQKYYPLQETLEEIRPDYQFNESCQGTVPQAIQAFLEAESFEDAIRNAISLGGDSDTLAAITGSIAEAYFGVGQKQIDFVMSKLDDTLGTICEEFSSIFGVKKTSGDLVSKAIIFATKAHSGQSRKGTNLPYIVHPLSVMRKLIDMGADTNLVCAGVLHDVLEDTEVRYEELVEQFNKDIADLVNSHTDDKTLPWPEQKAKALEELGKSNQRVQMLILGDKMDNLAGMLLKKDEPGFWDLFQYPREMQKWYYTESVKKFSLLLNCDDPKVRKAAEAYAVMVKKTFA